MKQVRNLLPAAILLAGCQSFELPEDPDVRETYVYEDPVPVVPASAETTPVPSTDDAADDPAIWIHPEDSSRSRILGTDKRSGLGLYSLDGDLVDFLPVGLPNNVDLRQSVKVGDRWIDLAAASNRVDDSVTLVLVSENGLVEAGRFPARRAEPYGFCMGHHAGEVLFFVTYKTGEVDLFRLGDGFTGEPLGTIEFGSQLEGCAFDDDSALLVVGEEARGIWLVQLDPARDFAASAPELLDVTDGESGIAADVEGVAIYHGEPRRIVASSQGNDSYVLYDFQDRTFVGRFRIGRSGAVDGSQETDGLEVTSLSLGDRYPKGILVVQDGFNAPGNSAQNFKIVDWREIERALHNEPAP